MIEYYLDSAQLTNLKKAENLYLKKILNYFY